MNNDVLCRRIAYQFRQPALLHRALTHRSYGFPHNERLEFLGDGVLNFAIAGLVFGQFPDAPEGDLSRWRSNLVNQKTLSGLARKLELGNHIRLGEGELKSGGHRRPSILADTVEALLGAIYLDSGFAEAERVIHGLFMPLLQESGSDAVTKDPKTLLQEHLQNQRLALPEYIVITTSGEAHQQEFQVACAVPALAVRTTGAGTSRRSAEQEAASQAYEQILLQPGQAAAGVGKKTVRQSVDRVRSGKKDIAKPGTEQN